MSYRILCDFDGTVALNDVTDVLLEAFAEPRWHDIEAQWQAGLIGSRTCMALQVELLRCKREELDARLENIRIDPGFTDFVAFCRRRNIPLSIVSDGLDYAIARILAMAGIEGLPIIANRLLFLGEDRYAMESPYAEQNCRSAAGTCKCRTVSLANIGVCNILVGDGRSDFCAAETADFVFAKDALLRHCETEGIPHLAFSGFSHLTEMLVAGAVLPVPRVALADRPMVA